MNEAAPSLPETVAGLWHELAVPPRGFLRARTQTDADAEDLLQEVFVSIQRRLPDLREPAKLQGWVYRIARNAVTDHHRARREHAVLDFDPCDPEPADPEGAMQWT